MPDNLLSVHQEVKESFRDRIQDNDDLPEPVTKALTELSDEDMIDSEKIQEAVQEALHNEDS